MTARGGTTTAERCQFDLAMDALDLLELVLQRVDEQARRHLTDEDHRPEGDQP